MGLILPRSHTIHNRGPQFACTICEKVFTQDERSAYERHVISHAREDLAPHSPALQAPGIFGTEGGDEDWTRWVERHRAIDPEGRNWATWGRTEGGKAGGGLGDG
jgi:hypothetical protein